MESGKYKFDLVEIIWDDAECGEGWDVAPTKLEEKLSVTIGFKLKETKKHILVAHTVDHNEVVNTNGRIQIPKGMIKKITVLKAKALD